MGRTDFPLLTDWLAKPHVVRWWREPLDLAGVEAKYGPRVDGVEPTRMFIIEHEEKSIGWIQWYRWADYPKHAALLGAAADTAGVDLSLGEEALLGRGIGSVAIGRFIDEHIFADPAIRAVISDPEEQNRRSVRAFEKAGFSIANRVMLPGEDYWRCVVRLDRVAGAK